MGIGTRKDGAVAITALTESGQLEIVFRTDGDGRVTSLRLTGIPVSASELSRIPWARLVAAAEASKRHTRSGKVGDLSGLLSSMDDVIKAPPRPGRKGHAAEHYQRVAARYNALKAAGEPYPIKTMTREWSAAGEPVSPHTVSTWVKKCQDLGLVPVKRRTKENGS